MSLQDHFEQFTRRCPVCRQPWDFDAVNFHGSKRTRIRCNRNCLNHQATCHTSCENEQFEHLFSEYQRLAPSGLLEKAITGIDDPFHELLSLDYVRRFAGLSWHGAKLELMGGIATKVSSKGYRDRLEWWSLVACKEDGQFFILNADNPCSINISTELPNEVIMPDRWLSEDDCLALDVDLSNPSNVIKRDGDRFFIV